MKKARWEWMDDSACQPGDDADFFLGDGERYEAGRFDAAKKICAGCPVKIECEEYRRGFKRRPTDGVWAGRAYLPRGIM